MNVAVPTPVQNLGTPVCTSIANASMANKIRARPTGRVGSTARPYTLSTRNRRADTPGDAHPGDEELEHEEHEADRQQEVRDRRARDGVEEAGEQVELEEANLHDRLGARPA